MLMDETSGHLPARDGTGIFYQLWETWKPKAWIIALHGLGAHGGWYESLASCLLPRRISSVAPDMRGHGLTKQPLGRLPSPSAARSDVEDVVAALREKAGSTPVFGMGTSLGGAVLLSFLAGSSPGLQGGILLSPAVKQRFISKGEMVRMSLGLLLGDRVRFPTPLERGLTLTSDVRRQDELRRDNLSLRELPSRAWVQARRIMRAGRLALPSVHVPMLVVQARDDEVIDARENATLFEGRHNVTWAWWEGAHDVKLSADLDGLSHTVAEWIETIAGTG